MLPRNPDDVFAPAEVDAQALFASAHADERTGEEIVFLTREQEAFIQRLDTPDTSS